MGVPYGGVADYLSYANTGDFGPFPFYSPIDWLWYPEPYGIYQNYGWNPYLWGGRDCDDGRCGGRRQPRPFGYPPPAPTSAARFEMAAHDGDALGAIHGLSGGFHDGMGGMGHFGGFHDGGGGHR